MKKEHDSCSPLAWTWAPSSQTIPNAPSWNRLPTKPGHLGSETCWSVHVSTIGNLKKSVYRNIIRNDLQNACTRECSPFSIHDCLHSGSLNMEVEKTTFPCNQRVFHFHGPVSRSDLSFGVRRLGSGSSVAPSQRLSGGSAAWRGTTGPPHGRNARRGEVARSIDVRHRLQRGRTVQPRSMCHAALRVLEPPKTWSTTGDRSESRCFRRPRPFAPRPEAPGLQSPLGLTILTGWCWSMPPMRPCV